MKSLKVKLTSSLKQGRRNIFANVGGGGAGGLTSDLKGGGGGLSLSHLFIIPEKVGGRGSSLRRPCEFFTRQEECVKVFKK